MNANDRADGQAACDAHTLPAAGSPSPQATPAATPIAGPPADLLAADHSGSDIQWRNVGGDPSTPASHLPTPMAHASGSPSEPPVHPTRDDQSPPDGWLELRIWCEQLEDAMQARIAATNRAERGGVDPTIYSVYIDSLTAAEHVCELAMKRCYRRVVPPEIVAWQKSERGIGEKLTARLLGHLGDPCIATPHHWEGAGSKRVLIADQPYERTVSQLWQYCGVGDPHRRKHKGMTADEAFALGNPTIKMIMHLHAEACVKAGSGYYRDVYDKARDGYDPAHHPQGGFDAHTTHEVGWVKTHATECVRCGPSGKPAQPGSPWSKGHQHAAALRKVAKEILRDLWRVRHAALCPPTSDPSTPKVGASAGTSEGVAS